MNTPNSAPVYTPIPMTMTATGTTTNYKIPGQGIAKASSSSSSSRQTWARCLYCATTIGRWMSRRRYELAPAAGTSLLTVLGLAQDGTGTAVAYGSLAVASGAAALAGLRHKNPLVTHVGAAGF